MRYPGHIEYMKMLKDSGFFSEAEIMIKGIKIKPIDMTARLLIDKWKLGKNEPEFTVMRIIIKGKENGKPIRWQYDLFDRYDEKTGISSMARTTGYTATSAVSLVLNGDLKRPGINPPEYIGEEKDCLNKILQYQKERGIIYRISSS